MKHCFMFVSYVVIDGHYIRWIFTGEPDGAASEAPSGANDLPPLAPTHMVGLVHHIGRPVQVLRQNTGAIRHRQGGELYEFTYYVDRLMLKIGK